ncbi:unnamed protein product [Eruca vesicaria subsp. sativa]|uniref:Uncharacterized protein n=1 Tax=Eruca vesicaria subsp. sativa TaxID=29727 RepID=A0ABC8KNR8_ERUVS|nr:unnamed protein product [Eruca vesicaria subsp. sativa]
MDFPPFLKLLHWEEYPGKCLPHTLRPENLVELNLENSKLRHLWEGTQPVRNLKKLILTASYNLEKLPDLANATNLEILKVAECRSLVEIHSSVGNLHKLEKLEMELCRNLQVVPTLFNLASLQSLSLAGCGLLRKLPDISATITVLSIIDTMLEEFAASIMLWSRLEVLTITGSVIPHGQYREILLEFSSSSQDIEIVECGVKIFRDLVHYIIHLPFVKQSLVEQFVEDGLCDESIAPAIVETMVDLGKTAECVAAIENMVDDYNLSLMTKNLIEDQDRRPSKKRKR